MGAKTTTFINDVNTLTTACQTPLNNMITAAATFKLERNAYQVLVDRSAARVTQLTNNVQWDAGGAPPSVRAACGNLSSEDFISRDPTIRQLEQQMDARRDELTNSMNAVGTARDALRTPLGALNTKVTAFDTYIKAKKRSTLNPFKKKSVGRAETVIATAQTFISSCQDAART